MLHILTCAYLALLLIRPQEFVPALNKVPIMQMLLLVCVGSWLFAGRKRLDLPQFALLLWFLLGAVLSRGMNGWWGGGMQAFAGLTPILLLFVLVSAAARELKQLRRLLALMIVAACIMVLHGRWQLRDGFGWTGLPPLLGRITYVGIFSDPNDLGQLFVMCMAFSVYFMTTAGTALRLLLTAVVGWLGYGIYMTDSRGTMLAALAVVGLEGARRLGKVATGVLAAMAAAVLVVTTRFGQISTSEQSAQDRIDAWYAGVQMLISKPLFGIGIGGFSDIHGLTAHNFLMLPMAELGLFGFLPWFGLMWFTGLMLKWLIDELTRTTPVDVGADPAAIPDEAVRRRILEDERRATFCLLATCVGFVVSSFFLSQSYKHVYFLVLALVVARYVHVTEVLKVSPPITLSRGLVPMTLAGFGMIVFMYIVIKVLL